MELTTYGVSFVISSYDMTKVTNSSRLVRQILY